MATCQVIDNYLLLTFSEPLGVCFVNCTRNALLSGIVTLLPSSGTVLEILEDVCADPKLLPALKAQGYRFALDDFTSNGVTTGFCEIADFVRVDFRATDADERHAIYNLLDRKHQICIAEKVEEMEDVEQARNEGYVLFQGYVFSSPIVSQLTDIARNDELYLSLLSLLSREKIDILRVAQLIEADDALSSRLLKLFNSPFNRSLYPVGLPALLYQ